MRTEPDDSDAPRRLGQFRQVDEELRVRGWRISLVKTTLAGPDGTVFERDVVRHPGAVAVVPLTADSSVLLVRQYRAAIDRYLLEIPAGTRDVDGEPPDVTARRELSEEVGMRAGAIEELGVFFNTPGFCDERTWLYLATDLEACATERSGIEESHMEVVEVSLDAIDTLVVEGPVDALSAIGLLMAHDRLRRGTPG